MDSIAQALPQDLNGGPPIAAPPVVQHPASQSSKLFSLKHPWVRIVCVLNHILAHSFGAAFIYGLFTLFDMGIEEVGTFNHMVFLEGSPLAFTLSSIFKWADLVTCLSFVGSGLWQACREMVR